MKNLWFKIKTFVLLLMLPRKTWKKIRDGETEIIKMDEDAKDE